MGDVNNTNEFEAWLEGSEQQVHIAIATRAALRAFPAVWNSDPEHPKFEQLVLLTGRAILSSAVAALVPTAELDPDLRYADSAAASAAFAADPASFADCVDDIREAPAQLFQTDLWHGEPLPKGIAEMSEAFLNSTEERMPTESF